MPVAVVAMEKTSSQPKGISCLSSPDSLHESFAMDKFAAQIRFTSTVEIPYAIVSGPPVTLEAVRAFGHDLARALRKFLDDE